jgi:hypothetical protein
VCEPQTPERRNDLWIVHKAFDYGLEENLRLWEAAAGVLDGMGKMAEEWCRNPVSANDALLVALADCEQRCKEEVKRHKAELQMRQEWSARQPESSEL